MAEELLRSYEVVLRRRVSFNAQGLWKIIAVPVAVALLLASSVLSDPVLATGIIMTALVATNVWVYRGSATVVA
jgi:hypothetical protein